MDLTPFPGCSSDEEPAASSGTHSPTSTGTGISKSSPASVLSNFLVVPEALAKLKRNPSGVARVLTSKENMELLEAKEKKRELEEEKKKRKEERERKAREREQQKREKERIRQDKKKKTACGQTQGNSTLQRRKAIPQKLLQVAIRTVYLRSFTVLASCKSVSTTSFLVTKKFDNQHHQRLSSKFKVNSTCPYIRSIRNYGILIYCYVRAVRTEQYPALLLHAKRSTRCKSCMIGRLKFDNQHT